jgi:hypothetical protein
VSSFAQDDVRFLAGWGEQATATAKADPCGMTNKRDKQRQRRNTGIRSTALLTKCVSNFAQDDVRFFDTEANLFLEDDGTMMA